MWSVRTALCFALLIVACDEGADGLYCESDNVKTCQGSAHLPGCTERVVSDCGAVDGKCAEHGREAECVLDRTCPETAFSVCDGDTLLFCWHGRVIAGAVQPCPEGQSCAARLRDDDSGVAVASCVPPT